MKLERVIIENFRSYKERVSVKIDDLTAFIGKNDIGKSTILEALEIFFNNNIVKIEQDDLCVYSTTDKIRIGCVFSEVPTSIVIDSSSETTLKQEYLLNDQNQLEIHKVYDCSKKTVPHEVLLIASYPTVKLASDLHELNQSKLKKRISDLRIDETSVDLRSNVSMRQAIYNSFENLELSVC